MPLRKDVTKPRSLWGSEASKAIDLFLVKQLSIPGSQRADIIRRTQRWILAKAESHSDGFDKEDLSDERVKNKVTNRLSYLMRKKKEREDTLAGHDDDDDDGDDVFEVREADANPVEEEDPLRPLTPPPKRRALAPMPIDLTPSALPQPEPISVATSSSAPSSSASSPTKVEPASLPHKLWNKIDWEFEPLHRAQRWTNEIQDWIIELQDKCSPSNLFQFIQVRNRSRVIHLGFVPPFGFTVSTGANRYGFFYIEFKRFPC